MNKQIIQSLQSVAVILAATILFSTIGHSQDAAANEQSAPLDYNQLIVNAGSSLKAGQLDQARQDVQEAIKLNATNYMAYVIAAKIAAKQNDTEGANNFAQKALELAPDDDKDKLRQFANELQSTAPTPTTSTEPQSATPASLSDDDQLKHDGLMQILADAAKSDDDNNRNNLFRQFLTRSVDFADAHPDQLDIWEGRAYTAMQLDYPDTGWLAGKWLKTLGAIHSDDSKVHAEMVELESKGWLDNSWPGRDWSKWTIDQVNSAANQGDAAAQDALGNWYHYGQAGLSQDYAQAVSWYQKAADQGYAEAQGSLGMMYEEGLGVDKNHVQGADWFRKSAEQGEPAAQSFLGNAYALGVYGVSRDYAQALNWLRKSAAQGNVAAEYNLGGMYRNGWGVTQDYAQASDWYRKAVAQGDSNAQDEVNWCEGQAFLAQNKTEPGVVTLPDGLQYQIINEGSGEMPGPNDVVAVNYRGTFVNGTEFDSSAKAGHPAQFPVGQVIPGWTEALQKMTVGSKWRVFIPGNLAYGTSGRPPLIEPNKTLIFDVELLSIQHQAAAAPRQPLTNDIIKVPSAEEMKNGAKIEIIKASDLQKMQQTDGP